MDGVANYYSNVTYLYSYLADKLLSTINFSGNLGCYSRTTLIGRFSFKLDTRMESYPSRLRRRIGYFI